VSVGAHGKLGCQRTIDKTDSLQQVIQHFWHDYPSPGYQLQAHNKLTSSFCWRNLTDTRWKSSHPSISSSTKVFGESIMARTHISRRRDHWDYGSWVWYVIVRSPVLQPDWYSVVRQYHWYQRGLPWHTSVDIIMQLWT
jgi:hypothetical protein